MHFFINEIIQLYLEESYIYMYRDIKKEWERESKGHGIPSLRWGGGGGGGEVDGRDDNERTILYEFSFDNDLNTCTYNVHVDTYMYCTYVLHKQVGWISTALIYIIM